MKQSLAINGGTPVRSSPMQTRAYIGNREYELLKEVLDSGILSEFRAGPKAMQFESSFASFHDCLHGVAVTSGTTALHLAVSALDIGPGDEVIVPPFTFVATASTVLQQYAVPVFADIDPITFCLSAQSVETAITPRTKAVIAVHLFGHPADVAALRDVTDRHGLRLIEDCAQAHGARYNGRRVGSWGDMGAFSFYQSKNMTCGEGGIVITNNDRLLRQLRLLKEHGNPRESKSWYEHTILGYNYQMSELQAAVAIAQLEKLEEMNRIRRTHAELYRHELGDLDLVFPQVVGEVEHVYHLYPVLFPTIYSMHRDWFAQAMEAENVLIGINYPKSLHQDPLFVSIAENPHPLLGRVTYSDDRLPVTLDVAKRILTLHTDPCLTEQDILHVCRALKKVWSHLLHNRL